MLIKLEGGGKPGQTLQKSLTRRGESGARLKSGPTKLDPELSSSEDMLQLLAQQARLPYVQITDYDLSDPKKTRDLISYVPAQTARDKRIFPLDEHEEHESGKTQRYLTIAIADPLDIRIVDDLRLMLPEHQIKPVVCNEADIIDYINKFYGIGDQSIEDMIDDLESREDETKTSSASILLNKISMSSNSPTPHRLSSWSTSCSSKRFKTALPICISNPLREVCVSATASMACCGKSPHLPNHFRSDSSHA